MTLPPVIAEIYGAELLGDGFSAAGISYYQGFMNWRLGALSEVGAGCSILTAYGGALESDLPRDDRLDYAFFLELLLEIE